MTSSSDTAVHAFPDIDELSDPTLWLGLSDAAEVERRIATALQEARHRGYEEGRTAGHRDGMDETRAASVGHLDTWLAALDQALGQLREERAVFRDRLAGDVVGIALRIAEAVVGHEISVADDPGRLALERALAEAPEDTAIVARLHPDDLCDLERVIVPAGVELRSDPSVGRGGCVLDCGPTQVDARLDNALDRVRVALGALGARTEGPHE